MAKWDNINGIIENAIKSNNAQSITGDSLQSVLKSIVSDVGANATFAGIAIASTSPGSYDGPVFYIAASAGTYAGFGSIVVNAGELAVLYNSANGAGWNKSSIGLSSIVDKSITKAKLASDVPIDAMQNKITQLETSVNTVVGEGATEAIENFAEILAFLNGITDTTTLEGLLTNLRTEIDGKLSNKVDKESGKQLSTNDYTTAEKDKLAGIAAGANNYTHPPYTARTGVPTANATPGFGGTFQVSQPVSDAQGHITTVNARTITIPNSAATTSAAGLMAASDKSKLDGIAAGAQVNTITGVKGNAEISYRTGSVNLTPENIGAAAKTHYHSVNIISDENIPIVAGYKNYREAKYKYYTFRITFNINSRNISLNPVRFIVFFRSSLKSSIPLEIQGPKGNKVLSTKLNANPYTACALLELSYSYTGNGDADYSVRLVRELTEEESVFYPGGFSVFSMNYSGSSSIIAEYSNIN